MLHLETDSHHFQFGVYIACILSGFLSSEIRLTAGDGLGAYLLHGPMALYSVLDDVLFLVGTGIT